MKEKNLVPLRNLLISTAEKEGVRECVEALSDCASELCIFATEGTYKLLEPLKEKKQVRLFSVSSYIGKQEMAGGLVKTMDFRIYQGLLADRANPVHRRDLAEQGISYIDMVICNFYSFPSAVPSGMSIEQLRYQIDIGGPAMLRAAAKNFPWVCAVCDCMDYPRIVKDLQRGMGKTSMMLRRWLAQKAFHYTAAYERKIADVMQKYVLP